MCGDPQIGVLLPFKGTDEPTKSLDRTWKSKTKYMKLTSCNDLKASTGVHLPRDRYKTLSHLVEDNGIQPA